MQTTQMSINRGIDEDVVHGYNTVLLNHKKQKNNAIDSNMESLATVIPRKSDRERQISYDIPSM